MSDWISHLQHGYKALTENHPTVAYTHFHAAFEENPEHPLVCWAWGQALAQTGNTAQAVALLEKAARAEPEMVEINCAWARAVLDLGDFDSARRILEEILEKHPKEALIHLTLVELFMRCADPEKAQVHLDEAVALDAEEGAVRVARARIEQVRGLVLSRAGDLVGARQHFENAISHDPAWAGPWVNLGVIAENGKDLARAQLCYREALRMDPGHPVALYNAARLYARSGDTKAARELVSHLIDRYPEYPGGRELADSVGKQD